MNFSAEIQELDSPGSLNAIEIYSLHVDCKVTSRFAHTVITSRVTNRANESKEALFEVELPKTAFITQFLMNIDGVTYPGIIKEKEAAQDQYDAAVSRGQSAGLVKSAGRKLEQFQVSVNVAAAGKVTFELTYEELLKRKLGKYEVLIKVKPKQLVNDFQIDAHIFEPQGISLLETDSTFMTNDLNNALIKEQDETKAHISFKPTISQQRKDPELEETLLDGDFLIRYDVKRSASAGDIQIVNGYFVHYFAPSEMAVLPKNIIFVIDKSGSMSGKKIDQTREALQKILEDLNPEDHFNLVVFSADVAAWKPSLLQATEENVEMAKQYVRTIRAQGGTDINGALLRAIGTLDEATAAELLPEESISMIILLTDGQPTVGVTEVGTIQSNIKGANQGKYFLYCLGFGFDVSYKFLEKMALDNGGVARRIYEDSDAALQLQDFYQEVATPILKEIEMKYPDSAALEITQNTFKLLFDGSEIVVAGKIGNEIDVFPVEISAQTHSKALVLKEYANVTEKEQIFQNQQYIFGNFTERLWAYLTIQQLLEKDVLAKGEQKKNLEAEALALSLKFNFVTPLTSMVVTKPDAQDVANKPTEADNENVRRRAYLLMHTLNYPHFIITLPGENDLICLHVSGQSQTPINLLSDPAKGIQITGKRGENGQFVHFEIAYQQPDVKITIAKEGIVLNHTGNATMFPWTTTTAVTIQGLEIKIEEDKSLLLSGASNTLKISYDKLHEHFLGLYFIGGEHFSDQVTGLLGKFFFDTHFGRKSGGKKLINVQGQTYVAISLSCGRVFYCAMTGNLYYYKIDLHCGEGCPVVKVGVFSKVVKASLTLSKWLDGHL
ncbi:inter-alpha-trypsin inhibitor heavy chain H4-like [Tiliqua scincoides]|uniref:inter-alpha-trypsin inhibitor heavy chain H4-like n=1 Tax=Tiliqua scincoides TaxID=71010 RepID=UPI0034630EE5